MWGKRKNTTQQEESVAVKEKLKIKKSKTQVEESSKPKKEKKIFKKSVVPPVVTGADGLVEPTILENISNEGVLFHSDYFEMQTGMGQKKLGRSFYIKPSGYPSTVRVNWLEALFASDDMDVSVHIEPYERSEAVRKLKDKIDEYEAVMFSAQKQGDYNKIEAVQQNRQDAKQLRDEIRSNSNGLYYVSVIATVYADSLYELNEKCVGIERNLSGESIEIVNAFGRQKEGWLSSLPLGTSYLKNASRNLDRNSLTAMFPHLSSRLNHDGGMPIGIYNREYIYFNNFDKKLTNYNLGIFGESGAGKGVFVKQVIGRGFSDGIEKVVILDVEPEYVELTYALGGIVVDIRSDGLMDRSSRINPLDIYIEKEIMHRYTVNEYVKERVNVNEKIKEAIEFFKVMKETADQQNGHITPYELDALDRILRKLYQDAGVSENPDSLYRMSDDFDENNNITLKREYIRMPQISDVKQAIDALIDDGAQGLDNLSVIVGLFTAGSVYGMFDCQTRILDRNGDQLPEDSLDQAPIINFNISKLAQNGTERPLAQHVLMKWIWNRFVVNNPKPKKRIIQDEAWMMLEYPTMMESFKTISARGRKWNVSLTLVSQRYEMFDRNEAARDVIAQLNSVAFLKQPERDVDSIVKTFHFSDDVGRMIRTGDVGDVILKANKEIVWFRSEPTPSEWQYINTNQNISTEELVRGGR